MKSRILLFIVLFGLILGTGFHTLAQSNPQEYSQLEKLRDAMDKKSTAMLKPILEKQYTIRGIPKGYEDTALEQFFTQTAEIKNYTITKHLSEEQSTRVFFNLTFVNGTTMSCDILITKDGKIKELNLMGEAQIIPK